MAELIARSEWTMDRTAQEFASVATTAEVKLILESDD